MNRRGLTSHQSGSSTSAGLRKDLRCDCGCLLARQRGNLVELKCRRCKRVIGLAVMVSEPGNCCSAG